MLSIIILTCNQCDHTLRCLDSLDNYMSMHFDSEVILVDNGSSDDTESKVSERGYSWHERLRYMKKQFNIGVASGRNEGIRNAKGDVIMFLDNDTKATADAVEKLYKYVLKNREVGVAAPCLKSSDGEIQHSAKKYPGICVKIKNMIGQRQDVILLDEIDAFPSYVIGACQIMRREVINRVGLLDERIFFGPEDADFCIRVREAGYKVQYLADITIIHYWQRATRKKIFSKLAWRHFCGLLYFYWKHKRII